MLSPGILMSLEIIKDFLKNIEHYEVSEQELSLIENSLDSSDPASQRSSLELIYKITSDIKYLFHVMPLLSSNVNELWEFLNSYIPIVKDPYNVSLLIINALGNIDPVKEIKRASDSITSWVQINPYSYELPENKEDADKIIELHATSLPVIGNTIVKEVVSGVKRYPFGEFSAFPYFLRNFANLNNTLPVYVKKAMEEFPDPYQSNYDLGVLSVMEYNIDSANSYFINAARVLLKERDVENAYNLTLKWVLASGKCLDERPDLLKDIESIIWDIIQQAYLKASQSSHLFMMAIHFYCDISVKLFNNGYFNFERINELSRLLEKAAILYKNTLNIDFTFSKVKKDKIRIGILGLSLNEGVVGSVLNNFVRNHDQDRFEIFYYDCGFNTQLTRIMQNDLSQFATISVLDHSRFTSRFDSAMSFANLVYEDEVDILINQDWLINPVAQIICAFKPAPIMLSTNLNGVTTGMDCIPEVIDYDGLTASSGIEFSENLNYMPIAFSSLSDDINIKPKQHYGLPEDAVVLYVSNPSFSDRYFDLIFRALLKYPNVYFAFSGRPNKSRIFNYFSDLKFSEKLVFLGGDTSKEAVFENMSMADIYLNPFPRSSVSEIYVTMLVGKPVVTMQGSKKDIYPQRIGASLVSNKLCEADTFEDYFKKLSEMIESKELRQQIGSELHKRALACFDVKEFVAGHEKLFEELYSSYLS